MMARKKGMALPLVIVVLLVGMVVLTAALTLVENFFSTANATRETYVLYNAAQSGLQRGKAFVQSQVSSGILPAAHPAAGVTSADLSAATDPPFSPLVITGGDFSYVLGDGTRVRVLIYDLKIDVASATFQRGFPPRLSVSLEGQSILQGQSYESSNRGGDTSRPNSNQMGIYLVRSTATTSDGRTETVEQAFYVVL